MTRFSLYRPACDAPQSWNIFKTLLQIIVFWSTFLFLFPLLIVQLEDAIGVDGWRFASGTTRVAGGVALIGFSMFGLWSGYVMSSVGGGTPLPMDCARQLVIRGPYKFVRNPMAVAGIGQGVSVGIILGSGFVIVYAIMGAILWHVAVRPSEESDLEERFGDEYRQYRRRVGLWMPRMR